MQSSAFVTRLRRGAVASSLALAWLPPEKCSAGMVSPVVAREVAVTDSPALAGKSSHAVTSELVVPNVAEMPTEWTRSMEREFRRLALDEAKGTLTADARARLEELNLLRDRLYHPRTADDVLRQLRRDRMLEKISDTLRQYVEFREGAGQTRPAAA